MNNVVGSGPKGGCTVNLINIVDEPFFNLVMHRWAVQVMHMTMLWRYQKKPKKKLLKICQATSPLFSSKDSADTQEASKQKPDNVEDIEPSTTRTPSKRKLLQNRCPNRCSNSLRKLRRSLMFSRHCQRRRHWMPSAMRFSCMPFPLSQPNSTFLLLATVSTLLVFILPCLY